MIPPFPSTASLPAAGRRELWTRQILAVVEIEIRKNLLGKRAVPSYLLACMPMLLTSAMALALYRGWSRETLAGSALVFATIYQNFVLRFVVFFGCAWIFTNLYRGEVLDRSLHYYFLCPIRRDVFVAAKFLSGLAAAILVFGGATVVSYLILLVPRGISGAVDHLASGGLGPLFSYGAVTALACLGYGAVFLLAGLLVRNPMIPAVVVLGWESIHFLLPPLLKKLSVIHYLLSLCPIPVPQGPFAILSEPVPAWLAVPGIVALTAAALAIAFWKIRRTEIVYGSD